jgi:hypothetical protein
VSVQVGGDEKHELTEQFTVDLTGPLFATLLDDQAVGMVQNDDGVPAVSVADASVTEGNAGVRQCIFLVTLSNPTYLTATVDYDTAPQSATSGADYTDDAATVTFSSGDVSEAVSIAVYGDTVTEGNETFSMALSGESNCTLGDDAAVGTIIDDDTADEDDDESCGAPADASAGMWLAVGIAMLTARRARAPRGTPPERPGSCIRRQDRQPFRTSRSR